MGIDCGIRNEMDETEKGVYDKETELVTIGHWLKSSAYNSKMTIASSRDFFRIGQRHGQSQKRIKASMIRD